MSPCFTEGSWGEKRQIDACMLDFEALVLGWQKRSSNAFPGEKTGQYSGLYTVVHYRVFILGG